LLFATLGFNPLNMAMNQQTLKKSISITGIGLHTGKPVQLSFQPAPENTGLVFRRVDLDPIVTIPALTDYVGDTRLNTCLAKGDVYIWTIEHVLSALAGLAIDNVYIDLNAHEPPIMDGSAQHFVAMIQSAGIVAQNAPKQFIQIKRKISVADGDKFASLTPFSGFKVTMTIDFNHPVIAQTPQSFSMDLSSAAYASEISLARTFGFLKEHEFLKKNNLGLGASLENTLVLNDTDIVNQGGLRDGAEFVKHKILDAVGDLCLLGHSLKAEFTGYKSGHALNHALRQAVLRDPTAWELVT
jgi:UDP-3-O-[3-hydroxymyristoyl] N-acetylglucosamine deacetylase